MSQLAANDRLAFLADYYDAMAAMVRKFEMLFYPYDNSFELIDLTKGRRLFLRRTKIDTVKLSDLSLGSSISIMSRQLTITDYGDPFTKRMLANKLERTFLLVKPDGIALLGGILDLIYRAQLRVVRMKMTRLVITVVDELFRAYQSKPYFDEMRDLLTGSPVVIMEVSGNSAIDEIKQLCGPEDSVQAKGAAPLSIRARWGKDILYNCVHCSENGTVAERELSYFFGTSAVYPNTARLADSTLALVKPHLVKEGVLGQLIDKIQAAHFEVTAMTMVNLSRANAEEFLEVYKGVLPEYQDMVDELASGASVALEICCSRTDDVQGSFRQLCGPYDPEIARHVQPNTLRAQFGRDKVHNALHCTDLSEDAALEVEYFFNILDKPSKPMSTMA